MKWLIAREIPHLRRYARSLARTPDAADELVQETLEKALRKRAQWRRSGSVRSWLFTILYRTHLNSTRDGKPFTNPRDRMDETLAAADRRVEPTQDASLMWRDISQALDRLPEDQRAAILLVTLEDLSYDEAASVLGIPVGTLRSRVSRARDTLRNTMDPAIDAAAPIRRIK
nr:sigma-70 family RNA polymerase sigma factor [Marivibrio halodurans]